MPVQDNFTYWSDIGEPYFGAEVTYGCFCSFGAHIVFMGNSEHNTRHISTYPFGEKGFPNCGTAEHALDTKKTIVGNDVWIGNYCLIMGGVTIGDGAVIGAGSTVTKDVEPYSVTAGNPAVFKKHRFGLETRDKLMRLRWWYWKIEHIKAVAPILMSNDFDKLFKYATENNLWDNK